MKVGWGFWTLIAALTVAHFLLHVGFGFRAAPDLLTVALLLTAREVGIGTATGVGLAAGLLEDSLSVLAFGANGLSLALVGAAGAATRDLFVGDSRLFVVSYFVLGKWFRDLVHWVAVGDLFRLPFVDQVVTGGLVGGAYAAVAGLILVELVGLRREGSA